MHYAAIHILGFYSLQSHIIPAFFSNIISLPLSTYLTEKTYKTLSDTHKLDIKTVIPYIFSNTILQIRIILHTFAQNIINI